MTDSIPKLTQAQQIDELCDEFEAHWGAGGRPRIEDLVAAAQEPLQQDLLRALLAVELELLSQSGKTPSAEDYHQRFPAHTAVVESVLKEARREQTGEASPGNRSSENTVTLQDHPSDTSKGPVAPGGRADEVAVVRPGKIGRFEVHSVLGEGAFGIVYRARDVQLDRDVAIKVPREGVIKSKEDRERFLREARAAAGLNHTHICPVYEVGQEGDKLYLVMAYVPGRTLAELIKSGKHISDRQAAAAVRRLAMALDEAHRHGVVHRDLKPANIMVNASGDPVVMDFGLAMRHQPGDVQLTHSGMVMGTPAYMSPEQARGDGKSVGPAADIYSLGVILYELLAGRRPFHGTSAEVLGQILHVEPQPPSHYKPGVDAQLEAICNKAIHKNPERRFGSMRELAAALSQYLKSSDPTAAASPAQTQQLPTTVITAMSVPAAPTRIEARLDSLKAALQSLTEPRHDKRRRLLVGAAFVGIFLLLGILFFLRTPTATVLINIEVDLKDPALRFVLDGKEVPADKFAVPMELAVGDHELYIWRGEKLERKFRFDVQGGDMPKIAFKEQTPAEPDPDLRAAEWMLRRRFAVTVEFDATGEESRLTKIAEIPRQTFRVKKAEVTERRPDVTELSGLRGCKALQSLSLLDAGIQDDALVTLQDAEHLDSLSLDGTLVTDGGLRHLSVHKQLRWLGLHRTRVTAAGLVHLQNLRSLTFLSIPDAIDIHCKEAQALRAALPNCDINIFRKPPVADADRRAAEWVLGIGGTISVIKPGGQVIGVGSIKELPGDRFYLKDIHLWGNSKTNDEVMALLAPLEHLKGFINNGGKFTDKGMAHLGKIQSLQMLGLAEIAIGDEGLAEFKNLNELTDLSITSNKVTDTGLASLAKLPQLRSLALGGTAITDQGAKTLATMPQLEGLSIARTKITNVGLASIATCNKVMGLDLADLQITDAGIEKIATMSKLRSLRLNNMPITDRAFDIVGQYSELDLLELQGTNISDVGIEKLIPLSKLHRLYLSRTQVTDAAVKHLSKLKQLQQINLDDTGVTDAGEAELQRALPGCKIERRVTVTPDRQAAEWALRLNFQPVIQIGKKRYKLERLADLPARPFEVIQLFTPGLAEVDDASLVHFNQLALLEDVNLDDTPVTDAGLPNLAGRRKMWALHLCCRGVTDAGLVHLKDCTALTELWLHRTRITGPGLVSLKNLSRLGALGLSDTELGDEGLKNLPILPSLRVLSLDGTKVGAVGLRHLHQFPNLTVLTLNRTSLQDSGLRALAALNNLTTLQIGNCGLTDSGLESLKGMTKLSMLCVNGNPLTDEGLVHLKGYLDLKTLWLRETNITAKGLAHLQGLLQLELLEITNTPVDDEAIKGLAKIKSLRELYLGGTKVTDLGLEHLQPLSQLSFLRLTGSRVTDAGVAKLRKALPNCAIER